MTENENIKATFEDAIYCAKSWAGDEVCEECRLYPLCHTFCDDVAEIIVKALDEIQKYRAIGTVEELINTQIREKVLNVELESYKEIGTVEEFKALKEKIVAKKPIDKFMYMECPACGDVEILDSAYCSVCGQKLDWSTNKEETTQTIGYADQSGLMSAT